MEAWQGEFIKNMERSMHSSPIMLALFDQETATRNYVASEVKEARADERLINIRSLMETLKLSAIEAMNALKIPTDQQATYAAQL